MRLDTAAAARYLREKHGIPVEERRCATVAPLARIAALPAGILVLSPSTTSPNWIDGHKKTHWSPKIRTTHAHVSAYNRMVGNTTGDMPALAELRYAFDL
jgi:hypothetical protein